MLIALALTVSCSTSTTYNPSVYEYNYDTELIAKKAIKKVILAPVNLGAPPPSHLRKGERKVRAMVKNYLISNGYEVLPDYQFVNAWKQASRTYGNVYDPTTGKIDINAWRGAMVTTGKILREQTDADAVIFADLFEHDTQHSYSMKHYARWYGVTRKPSLQGAGNGVPADFNWGQQIKAASLMVTIYDVNLTQVFSSRGGIDTLHAIDIKRSNPAFVRRKKLLKSENHIEEGIELAFHPFITMESYPGKKED
jgi:hypothetical protein